MLVAQFPEVRVEGFDISPRACQAYRQLVGRPATECDLLLDPPCRGKFDAAIIIGGLHHMVSNLERALANIGAILKPNGILLTVEPNKRFFLNGLREAWYERDRYFDAQSERPLDALEIARAGHGRFALERITYFGGGPAYFLIQNSLILRLPLWLKRPIATPLMMADAACSWLPARFHAAFCARFRHTPLHGA
jgi:SAM-dependent methyltransferase